MSKITIKEIAERAGVSIGTVSRIVNRQPDGYSKETYEKVQAVIEETGYIPNRIARTMITKKSYTIGYLMDDLSNPFFAEIAKGISQATAREGFNVIFCEGGRTAEEGGEKLKMLYEARVDGIITGSYVLNEENIDFFLKTRVPFVILDANMLSDGFYNISVDNYAGVRKMTEYLIECGHKKIACVTGPSGLPSTQNRLNAFKAVMSEHGYTWNDMIVESDYTVNGGYEAMRKLAGKDYTAVFAYNDLMAIGVCNYLQASGVRVPNEISVAGFDDILMSSYVYPPLTTVHQPLKEMGEGAVELLMEAMNKNPGDAVKSKKYELTLVKRKSVSQINK